jgi:hypothetical protein
MHADGGDDGEAGHDGFPWFGTAKVAGMIRWTGSFGLIVTIRLWNQIKPVLLD